MENSEPLYYCLVFAAADRGPTGAGHGRDYVQGAYRHGSAGDIPRISWPYVAYAISLAIRCWTATLIFRRKSVRYGAVCRTPANLRLARARKASQRLIPIAGLPATQVTCTGADSRIKPPRKDHPACYRGSVVSVTPIRRRVVRCAT